MLTGRLNADLDARLEELAETTGRSKSQYVREAIETFLDAREDYLLAISILEKAEPTLSLDELRHELGV